MPLHHEKDRLDEHLKCSSYAHRSIHALEDLSLGLWQNHLRFSAAPLAGLGTALNQDSYACRSPDFFAAGSVGG